MITISKIGRLTREKRENFALVSLHVHLLQVEKVTLVEGNRESPEGKGKNVKVADIK